MNESNRCGIGRLIAAISVVALLSLSMLPSVDAKRINEDPPPTDLLWTKPYVGKVIKEEVVNRDWGVGYADVPCRPQGRLDTGIFKMGMEASTAGLGGAEVVLRIGFEGCSFTWDRPSDDYYIYYSWQISWDAVISTAAPLYGWGTGQASAYVLGNLYCENTRSWCVQNDAQEKIYDETRWTFPPWIDSEPTMHPYTCSFEAYLANGMTYTFWTVVEGRVYSESWGIYDSFAFGHFYPTDVAPLGKAMLTAISIWPEEV